MRHVTQKEEEKNVSIYKSIAAFRKYMNFLKHMFSKNSLTL